MTKCRAGFATGGSLMYMELNKSMFMVCYFVLYKQIMKLEIEEIAAQRSFIFLWCGSHEGLDEGRKVK